MYFPISNGLFNGVIQYIRDNRLQSIMNATSSGCFYLNRTASVLLHEYGFYTEPNDSFGQWILFEFKKNSFDFEGYSLYSDIYHEMPSSWDIEVSPDNVYWALASSKTGENTYTPGQSYSTPLFKGVRYIKLTQTGRGGNETRNTNYMLINRIDFFGRLHRAPALCTQAKTCRRSKPLSLL